jgi:hypothetical protein
MEIYDKIKSNKKYQSLIRLIQTKFETIQFVSSKIKFQVDIDDEQLSSYIGQNIIVVSYIDSEPAHCDMIPDPFYGSVIFVFNEGSIVLSANTTPHFMDFYEIREMVDDVIDDCREKNLIMNGESNCVYQCVAEDSKPFVDAFVNRALEEAKRVIALPETQNKIHAWKVDRVKQLITDLNSVFKLTPEEVCKIIEEILSEEVVNS